MQSESSLSAQDGWSVHVIEDATGEVVKCIPVRGEREAERVESAIDSKIDHEKYTCYVVSSAKQHRKMSMATETNVSDRIEAVAEPDN